MARAIPPAVAGATVPAVAPRWVPGAGLGEVFTRAWVAELVLDLVGYTPGTDLATKLAVEPACGTGAFFGPMVERLIESARRHGRDLSQCTGAVRAFDLQAANISSVKVLAARLLRSAGVGAARAEQVAGMWVHQRDFLLEPTGDLAADFVIGNPPYVRLEDLPRERSGAYRRTCPTMRGRSDIYVGFIERSLGLLVEGGALGFIVADRWMHNQYGARLRSLINSGYAVEAVLEMHDADAFEQSVSAYPAITVIRRSAQGKVVLASTTAGFGPESTGSFAGWATRGRSTAKRSSTFSAVRLPGWFEGPEPWPSGDPGSLSLVGSIEARFPPLEDVATGTRVGIGVATGADDIYITSDADAVERERLLPLVMGPDTRSGQVRWQGHYLVNPWDESGPVDLDGFPRLKRHYCEHRSRLERRHVARAKPAAWYRTIDRVWPQLLSRPKLLVPDIKSCIHPVLDPGGLYPHHNLYHVTSRDWDLEVLGGLLLSDIAELLVRTYCVKMRGGFLRLQAQYLRRIRVPRPEALSAAQRRDLTGAFLDRDRERASSVARALFR